MQFGSWLTLNHKPLTQYKQHEKIFCVCICGQIKELVFRTIKSGRSKSCGCQRKNRLEHGFTETPTWNSWYNMMRRCYDQANNRYYRYGKRGIKVVSRWHKFTNFLKDMGVRPRGKSLDRIDIDKDYSKENCKWSTAKEQANNTSRTINNLNKGIRNGKKSSS
jgi:hypothetical protein